MKNNRLINLVGLLVCLIGYSGMSLAQAPTPANDKHGTYVKSISEKDLITEDEKLNYAWGLEIGERFKDFNFNYIPDAFLQGIKDGKGNGPILLGAHELHLLLANYQAVATKKISEKYAKDAKENLEKGNAYLEENKKKKGVMVTSSGLQYRVLKPGNGKRPDRDDVMTLNYSAKYIDGKEFDSSSKRNGPTKVTFKNIISGWKEALEMMSPGAKWEIVLPPNLAYGEQGKARIIGPNATLVFDLELVSAEKETQPASNAAKDKP